MPRVKNRIGFALLLLMGPLLGCLRAEQIRISPPEPKTMMQQLSELLDPVDIDVTAASVSPSDSTGTREVRVRWTTGSAASSSERAKAGPPPAGAFSAAEQRKYAEAPPRKLAIELAPGRLFIAAVDRNKRLKGWTVVPDPRIVRSEGPGPGGVLTGQTLHLDQAEFFVVIPDDPDIVELRLYEPQPSGRTYKLSAVGTIALNR